MPTQDSSHTSLPIRVRGVAQRPRQPKKKEKKANKDLVAKWNDYFGQNDNNLAKWQQLCCDLGKPGETLTSKTKCRKALKGVWVNIHDFLHAENKPEDVRFFESERALSAYTLSTHKVFPRNEITPGSPLRDLLAHILYPRGGRN
ncbi:hypothetical protein Daus18300_000256 [Diaporthe australafricana]|uniref:Uncharacterized protein n=1 Tax=Diaporthe australafricana TaxID=127596 RepID=A0ABR3Y5V4_9PEZI